MPGATDAEPLRNHVHRTQPVIDMDEIVVIPATQELADNEPAGHTSRSVHDEQDQQREGKIRVCCNIL